MLGELRRALAKSGIRPRKAMGVVDALFEQGPQRLADPADRAAWDGIFGDAERRRRPFEEARAPMPRACAGRWRCAGGRGRVGTSRSSPCTPNTVLQQTGCQHERTCAFLHGTRSRATTMGRRFSPPQPLGALPS